MTLRADDDTLAAHLLAKQVVSPSQLVEALRDSSSADRDLGDSLVHLGLMATQDVVAHRAQVARLCEEDASANSITESDKPVPDVLDHDTWFDIPRPQKPGTEPRGLKLEATLAPGTSEATPTDFDLETAPQKPASEDSGGLMDAPRVGGAAAANLSVNRRSLLSGDEHEGLEPTRPYDTERPMREGLLDTITRHPLPPVGASAPLHLSDPWADPEVTKQPAIEGAGEHEIAVQPESDAQRVSASGRKVEERYQLLGEIGRGGMGRILKARDAEIGREVALKVLLGGPNAPDNLVRRFWTEVQATGQLEHPSIIPIHDVGRLPEGELFYVMKKLSGQSLAEILVKLKKGEAEAQAEFTQAKLLTIYRQIAYAVAYAHAHGVIHRDIKPANIMVGAYGEAILIDWGLAKVIEDESADEADTNPSIERVEIVGRFSGSETASGTITGTPQYMSPEATEGKPGIVTTKADVYGLGAVLYEILTYLPAFEDLGFVPTVVKVRAQEFVPPSERDTGHRIPRALEELCLKAMAKEPGQRPTAKELADELGRILEGAKERERRQAEAKQRVREGRAATERWKALKIELQNAESEAKRLGKSVSSWAELSKKREIWALEDRVSELKIEGVGAFEEAEAAFLRALGEVPEHREARSALASLYFARFGEAERARDGEGQRYYRRLVSRYDDGAWAKVLEGDGSLEVLSADGDLKLSLSTYELDGRVMVPLEAKALGRIPIEKFPLAIGSYLLRAEKEGQGEIVRPVVIGRTESVRVNIRFRSQQELGEGFLLVPEGPAILGGDQVAHGSLERCVKEVGEFAIARFPVTCDEYLAFLNALAIEDLDRALAHVPRARGQEGHWWRYHPGLKRFEYPEKSPGGHEWVGDLPVNGVSTEDAEAYIRWRAALTSEKLRLPNEEEWEKAARGVDGRFFPWGDHFDPTFCKMKDSRNLPYPEPEPVGAFEIDCSPYGARDMAGGVRELCWAESAGETVPVMRGGCWHDTGLFCRVAFRHQTQPDFVNSGLGFRLAKDLD